MSAGGDLPVTAPRVHPGKAAVWAGALQGLWAVPVALLSGRREAGCRNIETHLFIITLSGQGQWGGRLLFG